jgi:excisionase family DNA binding protein
MEEEKKPYTTGEIAGLCHVTINAVKKWIAAGKLSAYRTPGGHYRVKREDFMAFIEQYKMHIKDEIAPDRKRVLVVDDEPGVVEFVKDALAAMDKGYLIETAGDGYEALIKVGDFKPDLLVLDIRMPKIDGFEVCRRIKGDAATSDVKIFAVSAYGKEDLDKIKACGADCSMPKPIGLKEFQKNVERLLK